MPRCGFHAGAPSTGRAGVRMRLVPEAYASGLLVMTGLLLLVVGGTTGGNARSRDGGPVWSDPVTAAKQEAACHVD
ncbi:hypothetical protein GCM10009634_05890 [Saccharothrix xinjiangensis]